MSSDHDLRSLAERYHAWEKSDGFEFQRRARLLQSVWREERGLPIGEHRGRPLGSRLAMPFAEESLANYLTPAIREVVRKQVIEAPSDDGKLFARPRIFNDLLSSQPLCFNLFGELVAARDLASSVFAGLTGGRVARVTRIEFEHSPGRGDARYTGDRSAFDVYVEYTNAAGEAGFLGIEVKYHESLKVKRTEHRERYDEVAREMGCFVDSARERLLQPPLQQVWRDHLLAGSLLAAEPFAEGTFVFLYPAANEACAAAVAGYRQCLSNTRSFAAWTLESVVEELQRQDAGEWVGDLQDRYLDFGKLVGLG